MRSRWSWLLGLLFLFSNLSAQPITEFYPIAFAPERDWPAARDQIAILSRQDPTRPIVVTGFQEALELSFMGLPVVFVHHNQSLIRSFEKMKDLARRSSSPEQFYNQIPQVFTEAPRPEGLEPLVRQFRRDNGEILAEMHDFSPPALYSTPEDLVRILRSHGTQGFQNFQQGSQQSTLKSVQLDLASLGTGEQLKAQLGIDRVAIAYTGAYVRDSSFINRDGNTRALNFQRNIAELIAHTTIDGLLRRRRSIVSSGVAVSTRLARGTPSIIFESEDQLGYLSTGPRDDMVQRYRLQNPPREITEISLEGDIQGTPMDSLAGRPIRLISQRTGQTVGRGNFMGLFTENNQL